MQRIGLMKLKVLYFYDFGFNFANENPNGTRNKILNIV